MGEEDNVEGNKEETKEKKKEEETQEIVLKVDMHCQACARKIEKALKGFEGVEEVSVDSNTSKVVVKGRGADPIKVCERVQKKSGKKVELISPLPKPLVEKKEEIKEPQPQEKKEEVSPSVVTVVLKVGMHCEACAQVIQKRIRKIQGVESVETDFGNDQVIVKGVVDPSKLVDYVYKRTKKQASIVKEEEEKKEENKNEEKHKESEESKGEDNNNNNNNNKADIKRSEYWPSRHYVDYAYAPQIFSDEESKCMLYYVTIALYYLYVLEAN
ncbi:hypothetical protein TanjilG_17856 [Lupinus angustifolius]|uniref:HMA domain-containing protein n=1 Tax=Lupinus angustifolius TaxID=3871 RepID=A0A4P1QPX3_LUPAN|nr:PREDICTED: heavy metal-associated isoprenylated plant protein 7-like [Lupinus angustifolius]OIV91864.1 hypothetical protein TanjilG_17856 [Lupinus angustifolius]